MNSATPSTKTPAASIVVTYTEAGSFAGDEPAPFATFAAFDRWVRTLTSIVFGYRKTDFTITWADGITYEGHIDIHAAEVKSPGPILAAHVQHFLEWMLTQKAEYQDKAAAILTTYRIGDGESSGDTANDNATVDADVARMNAALASAEAIVTANRDREEARLMPQTTTSYTEGPKYHRARNPRETATLIRRELSAASKIEKGPIFGCVCRVNLRRSSTSTSIDVTIVSIPSRGAPILNPAHVQADDAGTWPLPNRLSKRGASALKAITEIVEVYNCRFSESRVHFYSDVRFDSDLESEERAVIRATLALLKQA